MLIFPKDVDEKILEFLGSSEEGKYCKVEFSMSANTDYWSNSFKMENHPFFNLKTTIQRPYLEKINLLAINNLGGITKVFKCSIPKQTLDEIKSVISTTITDLKRTSEFIEFEFGGGWVRKKFVKLRFPIKITGDIRRRNIYRSFSAKQVEIIIDVVIRN
ncbi:hypothetical protein HYU23_00685 [Candidatus Woesearchaeota archaeon]|nr:hypothetical protein [Candidatus Woesearchaeota archaeon]